MKYLLLVCWDRERMDAQTEPAPDTPPAVAEEGFPWVDDLQARGIWQIGDQLAPPRRARSVRRRGGKTIVTDGPFVETKEAVGGFDLLECGSFEEAVEIAAAHPLAEIGTIEVRPLWGN
jgi:hypothetical protein